MGFSVSKAIRYVRKNPASFIIFVKRIFRPAPWRYYTRFRMRLRKWLIYHQRDVHFDKSKWMGIPAQKNPLDAWIYQELIYRVRPDVIIEIGSAFGGGTLYLAHILDLIGNGSVVSVDIDRSVYQAKHDRIIEVTGDSASAEVISEVQKLCAGKKVMVIHDGDHRKDAVLRDLRTYSGLVSLGSYLIVEDGIVDLFRPWDGLGTFWEGPLEATREFLRENENFEVDEECERYYITYNPRGFLKRIK